MNKFIDMTLLIASSASAGAAIENSAWWWALLGAGLSAFYASGFLLNLYDTEEK